MAMVMNLIPVLPTETMPPCVEGSMYVKPFKDQSPNELEMASPADKGWRVYPLDSRPDAVGLYSGCTPGKRRAWFLPDDWLNASLVGLRGGWRHTPG
ncbi:hypothetical protein TNCV_1075001 [Trichonephila clavipes]|uniref:Uncharacterized protein n=1 Tax=Trichonephila clavipes TaxID=2585209 RepID=A0A8X6VRD5_TRICX|nr:hypothetical protein TNCV_1075001 [Trichonephila clavipes]